MHGCPLGLPGWGRCCCAGRGGLVQGSAQVLLPPAQKLGKKRPDALSLLREAVVDARGHHLVHGAGHDTMPSVAKSRSS